MSERDIFLAALALPPADRPAFLAEKCGNDADLRRRLDALFQAHAAAGSFLDNPPDGGATASLDDRTSSVASEPIGEVGQVIAGRYRLLERIGEGGMGSVWMGEQTEPVRRKVAVKLIKAGLDSRAVLARFEAERQALAMMDHPNIAKVLDAGATPDGRPFFAMELVKGVPITQFCDARKLTPRERLELFVPVCQAIQHAHQKGVIHRDVKPANVLIALYDDRPVPKVIDFGVAKATGGTLTEHTLNTGFGGVVGTPQYMSPEQATFNNLDIDTRSDVYGLGVLLYELLAGSPPFQGEELERRGLLEVLRVVREEEPPRPSTKLSTADALPSLSANRGTEPRKLTGLLRNELDWIVMKALEKDRSRRYETANGFAADVQRYLSGEPVQAHPPTAAYRLRKFVRKNRGPVAAVGAVLLALLAGLVGTSLALQHAEHERARANAAERSATDHALAAMDAADAARKAKKEEASQRTRANRSEADAIRERDEALRQKALVERQVTESKAAQSVLLLGLRDSCRDWPRTRLEEVPGKPVSVERVFGSVVETLDQTLPRTYEDNPQVQARARGLVAWLLDDLGLHAAAERQYLAALAQYRREVKDLVDGDVASTLYGLAGVLIRQGKYRDAEPALRQVIAWLRRTEGEQALLTRSSSNQLAETLLALGNETEAARVAERTLEVGRVAHGDEDETTLESTEILGRIQSLRGRWDEAERLLGRAVELRRRINTAEYPPRLKAIEELGTYFLLRNKPDDAATLLRECLTVRERNDPGSWLTFSTTSRLGDALLRVKNYKDAEPLLLKGYEGMKASQKATPKGEETRIPETLDRLVELYTATNKPDDAKKYRELRAAYREVLPAPQAEK